MSELATIKLLDVQEVADQLGVKKSWVYDRTRRRAIPTRWVGKYARFSPQEIDRWTQAGCPAEWEEGEGVGK